MNEPTLPNGAPDIPWPTSDHRMRVPDTSMLPGTEYAPPAAVASLKQAVQGAHDAIDRFADSATPKVRQMSDSVAAAGTALRARVDTLRGAVRRNPLVALAVALALGAAVVRVAAGSSRRSKSRS